MAYELDDIDKSILKLLQTDGRLTSKQLAYRLNRSPNPIYIRVKRLQDEGFIKSYAAIVNPHKLGISLIGYTQIQIKPHSEINLRSFREAVAEMKEVMECSHLAGKFDFLLKVAVKDMSGYEGFLMNNLAKLSMVHNIESFFVMAEVKSATAYPI